MRFVRKLRVPPTPPNPPLLRSRRLCLRAIRHWARARCLYSSKLGYFNGITLACMLTYVSQAMQAELEASMIAGKDDPPLPSRAPKTDPRQQLPASSAAAPSAFPTASHGASAAHYGVAAREPMRGGDFASPVVVDPATRPDMMLYGGSTVSMLPNGQLMMTMPNHHTFILVPVSDGSTALPTPDAFGRPVMSSVTDGRARLPDATLASVSSSPSMLPVSGGK